MNPNQKIQSKKRYKKKENAVENIEPDVTEPTQPEVRRGGTFKKQLKTG